LVAGLLPHASGPEGDLELDEDAHAAFEWTPIGEDEESHRNGVLHTAVVPVGAVVMRTEIDELGDVVEGLLTGRDLGAAAPEAAATYARLRPQLDRLLYPRAATNVTITWHTPDPPDDPLDGDGCDGGCAASNGDPHLVPVSGPDYDFQAAGEYTLLRATDGALEIQARQEPAAGSTTVAITTAIAARVGEHRLGLYRRDGGVEVLLDGVALAVDGVADLGGGASLAPYSGGVEVRFADGTVMWVVAVGSHRFDVMVKPSTDLRATGVGLLGPAADDGSRLPRLPDGSAVPAPSGEGAEFDLLYRELGPAWRVDAESSLFDYLPGEGPESFLVEDFPSRPLTYADLTPAQLALGEQACAEVGVALLREQCVFDVAVTGDPTFAETYLIIGRVVAEAAAGLGEPGPLAAASEVTAAETPVTDTPPGSTSVIEVRPTTTLAAAAAQPRAGEPTLTLGGDLVVSYSEHAFDAGVATELRGRVQGEEGAVLLLRTDGCPGEAIVFVSVTNVETGGSTGPFLCDPRDLRSYMVDDDDELIDGEVYVWLPTADDYDIVVTTDAEQVVPIEIELYTDPTPTIVGQGELLAGGHTATLSGIGDTIVFAFDGSAAEANAALDVEGLDAACAVEAYGAPALGAPDPWVLGVCDHGSPIGGGLAGAGFPVPVVVFARTPDEIPVAAVANP
jgi:hypothetical protein